MPDTLQAQSCVAPCGLTGCMAGTLVSEAELSPQQAQPRQAHSAALQTVDG